MDSIRFGMPSLLACASLEENAALCAVLGLDFVELNMNVPEYQADSLTGQVLPRPGGIGYTLHADENADPLSFDPVLRRAHLESLTRALRLAGDMGMPLLNMHIPRGVYFTLPEGTAYLYDRYRETVMGLARRFRDGIAPEAEKSRVTVCLENTSFRGPECLGDIVDCLLEAPCFALTYDAGHDFADGGRAAEYYRARANRLRHMHLHDCDGGRDHLPLGRGGVDKPAMLAAARERQCSVVLEAKTPTRRPSAERPMAA